MCANDAAALLLGLAFFQSSVGWMALTSTEVIGLQFGLELGVLCLAVFSLSQQDPRPMCERYCSEFPVLSKIVRPSRLVCTDGIISE